MVAVRLDTEDCDADVTVTTSGPLTHLCPFRDEVDHGSITLVWRCAGATLELHTLRDYLTSWELCTLSHEEITDRIRHDLSVVVGIELLSVETTWHTAGMEVQCSFSPTPAATP